MAESAERSVPPAPVTWPVIAAISLGGLLGSLLRYQAGQSLPTGAFDTTTLGVNVLGCLAMGVLVVVVAERPRAHRLLRPFLGTGLLGGFTTFSAYTVGVQQLLDAGRVATALSYLALTAVTAVAAAAIAVTTTRRVMTSGRGSRR